MSGYKCYYSVTKRKGEHYMNKNVMNYEIVNLEEKKVAGLTARTSNSDVNMPVVIGGLWSNFYQNGVYSSINNKISGKALGIYSDYESDYMGEYDITVACEVLDFTALADGVSTKIIPAGKYAKFIIKGHMQKAVAEFWEKLWDIDLDRKYEFDYEEYQDSNIDDAEIHIYISLKE